jgi:hypothetical protein
MALNQENESYLSYSGNQAINKAVTELGPLLVCVVLHVDIQ